MKRIIFLICILMLGEVRLHKPVFGQVNNESVYKRLLKTQEDYRKALLSGDSLQIAEQCYLLGKRFIGVGNYPKAQQWLLKSLRIRTPKGPSESIGKIYLRLSETQMVLNDLAKAKYYARLAASNFRNVSSAEGLSASYRTMGDVMRLSWKPDQKNDSSLDSASKYYQLALNNSTSLRDSIGLALIYQSLGQLLTLKHDEARSLDYCAKALSIYEQKKQFNSIADLSTRISQKFLAHNELPQAKQWLDRAVNASAQENGHVGIRESLLQTMAIYYERIGDWQTALEYNKKVLASKTDRNDDDQQEAIASINLAYENELNLAEMAAQRKQNVLQKRLTNALSILFAATGIACFLFYMLYVKYRKASQENALLVKEQNHRTKNNLQSVSDLLSLQMYSLSDPRAIEAMEESLLRVQAMTLVHRSLYLGQDLIFIGLQQFIPDLINMVLRTYRQQQVSTYYEIDPVLLHTDYAVSLGLILNELSTNACKYAFPGHFSPELHVSCKFGNGEITLSFQDNGAGVTEGRNQSDGFGMDLIRILTSRLKGKSEFSNRGGHHFLLSFKAEIKPVPTDFKEKLKVS